MAQEKLTQSLKAAAESTGDGLLQVILQVAPPPRQRSAAPPPAGRAERMRAQQEAFTQRAAPLRDRIAALGGEIIGEAWLNSTLSVRLPKRALEELARHEAVELLDLPERLERG